MTKSKGVFNYMLMDDITQAVLNWQNAVEASNNGQLEAFLGCSLGTLNSIPGVTFWLPATDTKLEERVKLLLNENHPTIIKMWMARNEL